MASRPGDWQLLGYSQDPVGGDLDAVDEAIRQFTRVTEALVTQATLIRQIGSGDITLLKGKFANELRNLAKDTSVNLSKAGGRYSDVLGAISDYRPQLEVARSETALALLEAIVADADRRSGEAMPDPIAALRPDNAPPLTDAQIKESRDRGSTIAGGKAALEAAVKRANDAMEALTEAAEAARRRMTESWNTDGLKTTAKDVIIANLKLAAKILGWIGTALAIAALFITGFGILAILGVAVAVASLAVSAALQKLEGGNVLNVVLAVLALGAFAAGAAAAKSIQNLQRTIRTTNQAKLTVRKDALDARLQDTVRRYNRINPLTGGRGTESTLKYLQEQAKRITIALPAHTKAGDGLKNVVKPTWWQVAAPGYGTGMLKNFANTLPWKPAANRWAPAKWKPKSGDQTFSSWAKGQGSGVLGIGAQRDFAKMQAGLAATAGFSPVLGKLPPWTWAGSVAGNVVPPSTAYLGNAVPKLDALVKNDISGDSIVPPSPA